MFILISYNFHNFGPKNQFPVSSLQKIEVRDSPNGIFGPWAWWVRGLARWESSWDAVLAAAAAVSRKSRISNVVILSFTTKSGAPDHIIRSVSSSQYDATNFHIISWHFRPKNQFPYETSKKRKSAKFHHFYRLWAGFIYYVKIAWGPADAVEENG